MSLLWFAASLLLWIGGGLASARGSARTGRWLLLATLGSGLCCLSLGFLGLARPPLGEAFWIRVLWSTVVLVIPCWAAFTFRFGRARSRVRPVWERIAQVLLWAGGGAILVLGRIHEPIETVRLPTGELAFVLRPPIGAVLALHALVGLVVVLWNLHATLEAARKEGSMRTARVIYSFFPFVLCWLYTFGRTMIYNQQPVARTGWLLGSLFLSAIGFAAALGPRGLEDVDLPSGRPVRYSTTVLTALGVFLLGLGILATVTRRALALGRVPWYEAPIVGILVLGFSLWLFPGLRTEIAALIERRIDVSRDPGREAQHRLDPLLSTARSWHELFDPLRELVREMLGPVHLQLWALRSGTGQMVPLGSRPAPTLDGAHPLLQALRDRTGPLPVTGEASSLRGIPLQVACHEICERLGLRIFFPVRDRDRLVGVLACGPAGGRTLHPEDLDLLQELANRLVSVNRGVDVGADALAQARDRAQGHEGNEAIGNDPGTG